MVANAAPRTPISNTKMNSGSRAILMAAPITTVSMAKVENPWAVTKEFSPSASSTEIDPHK